ncbi:MAG: protein translocase subunit SecD [Myxococcales bacterium]|nr:protein translocase subunit SecD [Myxococcales bacterium]
MSLRGRAIWVSATVLLFGYYAVANYASEETRIESPLVPDNALRLGLDLRGGIHWVIGVKLGATEDHELGFLKGLLEDDLERKKVVVGKIDVVDQKLRIETFTEEARAAVRNWIDDTGQIAEVGNDPELLVFELSDLRREQVREQGMSQVLEVLRRRINDDPITGIPESVVTRQGDDRVLVQIPGGSVDRARAREMLRVTGFLEFKIVMDIAQTEELLRDNYPDGVLPENTTVAFQRDKETDRILNVYLVGVKADLTGDYLTNARTVFDNQQRPEVEFRFNSAGGELFRALTEENIGKDLAIILDNRVHSAPTIRGRITTVGTISGRFSMEEANDLSTVLRAGSLSVPVVIEEERTVGPALGADSIRRGMRAMIVGLAAIVFFTTLYYRLSGLYACAALAMNLLMLIGVMSMFEATLTLPGLAGMVLTVGMAVDANVIIFERIREELRANKTPRAAISTGFSKAYWTIMDANITTLGTALVLYNYGTGPIKGFAVTLSIGVVTSVFAALVITRLMFAIYPGDRHIESLSI